MKDKNEKNVIKSNTFFALLAIAILTTAVTKTATAKSLYVITDIIGSSEVAIQPVQAYDIGIDGTLTFQAQHDIPHRMLGAVGMAIDSDSGYIFITYEASREIQLIEATTMRDAGTTVAPSAWDLAGIVYDHEKGLLYTVDRRTNLLYVYNWWPDTATLTHVPGSPFRLQNATAYGIALDEIDDLLYVANATNTINVYSTSNWRLVKTITLSRIAISIAIDVKNAFLYTGGGYADNMYLTQYHLTTNTEREVQVEPDAGVMGLGVDSDTGLVYMSTGRDTYSGGDNLLVYDKALNQIDIITAIGNHPTGLAIPGRDIGFNPLNLSKQVIRGASVNPDNDEVKIVGPGRSVTYGINFSNNNDFTVNDILIVDKLPNEVSFVTADDDGVNGNYDPDTHTYTWSYAALPPGSSKLLEITVEVNTNLGIGTLITNSVTINSNETAPTTTSVDVITGNEGLNIKKGVLGSIEGQVTQVDANDIITYTIDFDNKNNDLPVTGITVVDTLPKEVTFITASAGGNYDSKAHTCTWSLNFLAPGAEKHLELTVSINPGLPMGTFITNTVTVDCYETGPSSADVDIVTAYKPLKITKKTMDDSGAEIEWIMPGERFIYQICFDVNDYGSKVSDLSIVDALPQTVSFIKDKTNNEKFDGNYNSKVHAYTGTLKSMEPGFATCIELLVEVKPDTPLGTIIYNSVTIYSKETLPSTADVNLHVGEIMLEVDALDITPNELRRNGTSPRIKAIVQLPEGIKQSDIDPNDRPVISYQDRNTGVFKEIGISESGSYPTGTADRPTITVYFSRPELMNAVPYYGGITLRIEGKLKSGRIYVGEAIIHITIFAGD